LFGRYESLAEVALPKLPTVIVLASGRGERFAASGGQVHKLQALLGGKKIIDWTLDAVRTSGLPYHVENVRTGPTAGSSCPQIYR
jgi:molybdopterin-guanine dinucleotide biosynthesis protein A